MNAPTVGIHTIGQTPRPDLIQGLEARLGPIVLEIRGALDDAARDRIPARRAEAYPLETRLRNGTRVVVDARFLAPLLQAAISRLDDRVRAHLVVCAGFFPGLRSTRTLIQPFEAAVAELAGRGLDSIDVAIPFAAQADHARRKWEAAGFACRTHVLSTEWSAARIADRLRPRVDATCDAIVFDYVGLPARISGGVADTLDLPVFDVGQLGLDALERELEKPMDPTR